MDDASDELLLTKLAVRDATCTASDELVVANVV
jgi:hypothetical protein